MNKYLTAIGFILCMVCVILQNVKAEEVPLKDKVPFIRQTRTKNEETKEHCTTSGGLADWGTRFCGPTCMEMVFSYYEGREPKHSNIYRYNEEIEDKHNLPHLYCGTGTADPRKLIWLAGKYGYDAEWFGTIEAYGRTKGMKVQKRIEDLKAYINDGCPVLVQVGTGYEETEYMKLISQQHWMLVTGINDTHVIVNDPGKSKGEQRKYILGSDQVKNENKKEKYEIGSFMQAWANSYYICMVVKGGKIELNNEIKTNKTTYVGGEDIRGAAKIKNNGLGNWKGRLWVTLQKSLDKGKSEMKLYESDEVVIAAGETFSMSFSKTLNKDLIGPYYIQAKFKTETSDYTFVGNNADVNENYNVIEITRPADDPEDDPAYTGEELKEVYFEGVYADPARNDLQFITKDIPAGPGDKTINKKERIKLFRKYFIQALTVPHSQMWISLDLNFEDGKLVGEANVESPFENTDLARIFFEADKQLKLDVFGPLGDTDNNNVYSDWIDCLKSSPFRESLKGKEYNRYPSWTVSTEILPKTYKYQEGNNKFIAKEPELYLRTKNILGPVTLDHSGLNLTAEERNSLEELLIEFRKKLETRVKSTIKKVEQQVNHDERYQELREVHRIIAAAKLYKSKSLPNKPYASIINNASIPPAYWVDPAFDKAYWDNAANEFISEAQHTNLIGQKVIASIYGGCSLGFGKDSTMGTFDQNFQEIDEATFGNKSFIKKDSVYYSYGGRIKLPNPDLIVGEIGLSEKKLVKGHSYSVNLSIYNIGDREAESIRIRVIDNFTDNYGKSQVLKIEESCISKIDSFGNGSIDFDWNPMHDGTHNLVAIIDEKKLIDEHRKDNNTDTLTVEVLNNVPDVFVGFPSTGFQMPNKNVEFMAYGYDNFDGYLGQNSFSWYSDVDGFLGTGGEIIADSLTPGAHIITLEGINSIGKKTTDQVNIVLMPQGFPTAKITSHKNGDDVISGVEYLFAGEVFDTDDDDICAFSRWESDKDGILGTGCNLNASLSEGKHQIRFIVKNTSGNESMDSILINVVSGIPQIEIREPANDLTYSAEKPIEFDAWAYDITDGLIKDKVSWYSSIDNYLGRGNLEKTLSLGRHLLTANVVNSMGSQNTDSIYIDIKNTPPVVLISNPDDGFLYYLNDEIILEGSVTDILDTIFEDENLEWYSDIKGILGTGKRIKLDDLRIGRHQISLIAVNSRGLSDTASIEIEIDPGYPEATILLPENNSTHFYGYNTKFKGRAIDPQDGELSNSQIHWYSSIDGYLGTNKILYTSQLSAGNHSISLNVTDSDGFTKSDNINITILPPHKPVVAILYPNEDMEFQNGDDILFLAEANDHEDGVLEGNDLKWSSNIDGDLGFGKSLTLNNLAPGNHTITIRATDAIGGESYATKDIVILDKEPVVEVNKPSNYKVFGEGESIQLQGSASDLEDGILTGNSLKWFSNKDGYIGNGAVLNFDNYTHSGLHLITLIATDSKGHESEAHVYVFVASSSSLAINKFDNNLDNIKLVNSSGSIDTIITVLIPSDGVVEDANFEVTKQSSISTYFSELRKSSDYSYSFLTDLNQDDYIDKVTRERVSGEVYFSTNKGSGFDVESNVSMHGHIYPRNDVSVHANDPDVFYVDLDSDGAKDLVSWSSNYYSCSSNSVRVYWGSSTYPYFSTGNYSDLSINTPFCVKAFAVDFDNDGLKDIFIRSASTHNTMHQNNGDRTFTEVSTFDTGRDIEPIFDDFDGDGIQDLAYTKDGWADSKYGFRFNKGLGNGNFDASTYTYFTSEKPQRNIIKLNKNTIDDNLPGVIFNCSNDGTNGGLFYMGLWGDEFSGFNFRTISTGNNVDTRLFQVFDYNEDGYEDIFYTYRCGDNNEQYSLICLYNNRDAGVFEEDTLLNEVDYSPKALFKDGDQTFKLATVKDDSLVILNMKSCSDALISLEGVSIYNNVEISRNTFTEQMNAFLEDHRSEGEMIEVPIRIQSNCKAQFIVDNLFVQYNAPDLDKPELAVRVEPNNAVTQNSPIELHITTDDNRGIDSLFIEYRDSKLFPNYLGDSEYYLLLPTDQYGEFTVKVKSVDESGLFADSIFNINIMQAGIDLSVSSSNILVEPSVVKEGDEIFVTSKVSNTGTNDAKNVGVQLLVDGKSVHEQIVDIDAGSVAYVESKWDSNVGNHMLNINIDPANSIEEIEEGNNNAEIALNVLDITAPEMVSFTCIPSSIIEGESVKFQIDATDNLGVKSVKCDWQGQNLYLEYNPINGLYENHFIAENPGNYLASINITDESGISINENKTLYTINKISDLKVVANSIYVQDLYSIPGKSTNLYLKASNDGNLDVNNAEISMYVNGTVYSTKSFSIDGNSQVNIDFNYEIAQCSDVHFMFVVDDEDRIDESDETNNQASFEHKFCNACPVVIKNIKVSPDPVYKDGYFLLSISVENSEHVSQITCNWDGTNKDLTYNNETDSYELNLKATETGIFIIPIQLTSISGELINEKTRVNVKNNLPDLTVSEITVNPIQPIMGEEAEIQAVILNNGESNANNVNVSVLVNGSSLETKSYEVISAAGEKILNTSYIASEEGDVIQISIDKNNEIEEIDESNNEKQIFRTSIDNKPPVIYSFEYSKPLFAGGTISIESRVSDNVGISHVVVTLNGEEYECISDEQTNLFQGSIENLSQGEFDLMLTAFDFFGLSTSTVTRIVVNNSLPDLSINKKDIFVEPLSHGNVNVSCKIHNNGGSIASDVNVSAYVYDSLIYNSEIECLPGEFILENFVFKAVPGDCSVRIMIDPNRLVEESNLDNNTAKREFYVHDLTPPEQPMPRVEPENWTTQSNFRVNWNEVSDDMGSVNYEYRLDSTDWKDAGGNSVDVVYKGNGALNFYVRAIDEAGNFSELGTTQLMRDSIPPSPPALVELNCGRNWTTINAPYLKWLNSDDFGSGVSYYELQHDNGEVKPIGNTMSYQAECSVGVHIFKIRAVDFTGLKSEWSNEVKVKIDLDNPNSPFISSTTHPEQNNWYKRDSICLQWLRPDDTSGITGYYYTLNKDSGYTCGTSDFWTNNEEISFVYFATTNNSYVRIADGEWFFHIVSRDSVGHLSTNTESFKIQIDKTPPVTRCNSVDTVYECHQDYLLKASDYHSGVGETWYRVNNGKWNNDSLITINKNGENIIEYYSVDFAGNIEDFNTDTVYLDVLPEAAGEIVGKNTVCQGEYNVVYSVHAIEGAMEYVWTIPDDLIGSSNTDSIVVGFSSFAQNGEIRVCGSNGCGNGEISSLNININETPPAPIISYSNRILSSTFTNGNQWYNQGGLINDATDQNFSVSEDGTYYAIVTLSGCSSDTSNIIEVDYTSIDQSRLNNFVRIYPNPFSDRLVIENLGVKNILRFEIVDLFGHVIYEGTLELETVVETASFIPGTYIIKLYHDDVFEIGKFMKK